jgi:uncharacterized RDD family membrane protein YckC
MKCPKCEYLGFETGDRCKNCGYDFSLLPATTPRDDLPPRLPQRLDDVAHGPSDAPAVPSSQWADVDPLLKPRGISDRANDPLAAMPLDTVAALPSVATAAGADRPAASGGGVARTAAASLPLFHPDLDHDAPLIKLPAAPRPPLAVRRTPDKPRPRTLPKPVRRAVEPAPLRFAVDEPGLEFLDGSSATASRPVSRNALTALLLPEMPNAALAVTAPGAETSSALRRLMAAAIDHGMLLAIDAIVVYFTLKMAGLAPAQWWMLPPVPLLAFLAMVKMAYFCAFTLVGGQTIGKMAVRIRVVGDDGVHLDPARAIQRTLAGAVSLLAVGLGFLPVLIADDRRGVHDRVARTRVIALPSK